MGVFVAPASTATSPNALNTEASKPPMAEKKLPAAAPIKSVGVSTPPFPPQARVTAIAADLTANAKSGILSPFSAAAIVSSPRPRYISPKIRLMSRSIPPPITGFDQDGAFIFANEFLVPSRHSM